MSYNLIVKEEAHLEAWEAYLFYENRRLCLGESFLVAMERRIANKRNRKQTFRIFKKAGRFCFLG